MRSKKFKSSTSRLSWMLSGVLKSKRAEGYVDTAVKVLIAVVIGALLLFGLYGLVGNVVIPTTTSKVSSLFNTTGVDGAGTGGGGTGGGTGGGASPVSGMHMIVDGDSLNAVRVGDWDIDTCNWHQRVATALNLKYEIYTNESGARWYKDNLAIPWSMVAKSQAYIDAGASGATDFPVNLASDTRVNALVARVNEVEGAGDSALVLLNGGTNDAIQYRSSANANYKIELGAIDGAHTEDTYYGALQLWFDKLQARIPNATLVFVGAPYNASLEGWEQRYEGKISEIQNFRDAQKEVCEKYGIQYIDLYNSMQASKDTDYYDDQTYATVRTYLNTDGIHYNTEAGAEEMANVIIAALS